MDYEEERINRWTDEKDAWVDGYWFWDWSEQRQKVAKIDTIKKIMEVAPPYHTYGYRIGQWFYGFNLLSEIDEPGEYYIDREILLRILKMDMLLFPRIKISLG